MSADEIKYRMFAIKLIAKETKTIPVDLVLDMFRICMSDQFMDTIKNYEWSCEQLESLAIIDPYDANQKSYDSYNHTLLLPNMIEKGDSDLESKSQCQKNAKDTCKFDPVTNLAHYTKDKKYEPRKVIHDWVKYIEELLKIEDLKRAVQYIEFEIDEIENKGD